MITMVFVVVIFFQMSRLFFVGVWVFRYNCGSNFLYFSALNNLLNNALRNDVYSVVAVVVGVE